MWRQLTANEEKKTTTKNIRNDQQQHIYKLHSVVVFVISSSKTNPNPSSRNVIMQTQVDNPTAAMANICNFISNGNRKIEGKNRTEENSLRKY